MDTRSWAYSRARSRRANGRTASRTTTIIGMPTNRIARLTATDSATTATIATVPTRNPPITVCEIPVHVAPDTGAVSSGRHAVNAGATSLRSSALGTQVSAPVRSSEVMTETLGVRPLHQIAGSPTKTWSGLPYRFGGTRAPSTS